MPLHLAHFEKKTTVNLIFRYLHVFLMSKAVLQLAVLVWAK